MSIDPRRSPVLAALRSWRTASVSLLSFSSGLPLGLVWIAIPDWMRSIDVDIRIVGLFGLTQAPWSFKVLWSPLMDRFVPPFLGRRRGWAAIAQIGLALSTLALAGVGGRPETPWVVAAIALAIALASATQDIAVDAYAVEILEKHEQGIAVGARTALYRAAMYVAGGLSITAAAEIGWPAVNALLAACYLPMLFVTVKAPEPRELPRPPASLRAAVWEPFLGFLGRARALEILAFVFFYKFADNLAGALLRPFLNDMGYDATDRGFAVATVGLFATLAGTFLGGLLTTSVGLGPSLWIFGALQIFSNIGYVLVARTDVDRLLMYGATGFENLTSGLGTGAFSVLLLRMTEKRFSATQYALFSSLFGLPRILAGPVAGFTVDAAGWEAFLWFTMVAGIPGMVLLQRFAPLGTRDPRIEAPLPGAQVDRVAGAGALSRAGLLRRGLVAALLGFAGSALVSATLTALKAMRAEDVGFDLGAPLARLLAPETISAWTSLASCVLVAVVSGLFAAAVAAARAGNASRTGDASHSPR